MAKPPQQHTNVVTTSVRYLLPPYIGICPVGFEFLTQLTWMLTFTSNYSFSVLDYIHVLILSISRFTRSISYKWCSYNVCRHHCVVLLNNNKKKRILLHCRWFPSVGVTVPHINPITRKKKKLLWIFLWRSILSSFDQGNKIRFIFTMLILVKSNYNFIF